MIAVLFWLCVLGILYTYAGYPLLLGLLAAVFRPIPPAPPFPDREGGMGGLGQDPTPSLTLLIAAYNEAAGIAQKLENSLALDYPRKILQILVAADGSDDGTVGIIRRYARRGVELSYSPERRGKMAAINRAMSLARGEIVVFSDANNLYEPAALRLLATPFTDPRVGAVSGAKVIQPGDGALSESEGMYWKYESWIKEQETRLGTCSGVSGEIFALRRNLFEAPPENIINDDFYMAARLIRKGCRVVHVPAARSVERVSPTAQDEIIRRTRMIAGRYQAIALAGRLLPWRNPLAVWQIVSHKFLRPLVPFGMLGALLANLAAVIWPPASSDNAFWRLAPHFNWLFFVLQMAFYGLAWLGSRVTLGGRLGKLLYLPTFLVNSNLAAVFGLFRYLTRREGVLWERVQRRSL